MYSNERRPWSLPSYSSMGLMRGPLFKEPDKEEPGGIILLNLHGSIEKQLEINRLTTANELSKCLMCDNLQFIHNGRLLPNNLSFQFLGIQSGDSLFVNDLSQNQKHFHDLDEPQICHHESPGRRQKFCAASNYIQAPNSLDSTEKLKYRFYQKWASKCENPDSVYEKVLLCSDPNVAAEAARIDDLHRAQIESNILLYRKVCHRYSSSNHEKVAEMKAPISPTIVPKKSILPSTDLLPVMSYGSSLANLNHGSSVS